MNIRIILGLCGVIASLALVGCDTPGTRARSHSAAFGKLSAHDQRSVLAGKVHLGMSAEAVYIAWGEPDRKQISLGGKESSESWFYRRQSILKAPMDSFDRWLPGSTAFGPRMPFALREGFGFGGVGNEGNLFTQPHLLVADDTIKRADFTVGKLSGYDLYRAGSAPAH